MILADLDRPPDEVARDLLGTELLAGDVVVRLTEVEAYGGGDDPASHAYRGQRVANATMFGPPGRLYVYLSYGLHSCANVVCSRPDVPGAVLLRGAEVLQGLALVEARRGRAVPHGVLDGPGKLCQGLAIDRTMDGTDLFDPASPVRLGSSGGHAPGESIVAGPRIGLTKEVERPWRFRLVRGRERARR